MMLTGRVALVIIKDDTDPDKTCRISNAKLELVTNNPKLIISIPPDYEIICEVYLKDCSYVVESSNPGTVECLRVESKQQTLIIMDTQNQSVELLQTVRDYLTNPPAEPVPDEKVNRLLTAVNDRNVDTAGQIARQLAQNKTSIKFRLDMINESGNAVPVKRPQVMILLKLSIESYLIDKCSDEKFDVAVLPETTIKDLTAIVQRDVGILPNQQYWYINREHLRDDYIFGISKPSVHENTVLTLYIAKPQNI